MKQFFLAIGIIGVFILYSLSQRTDATKIAMTPPKESIVPTDTSSPTPIDSTAHQPQGIYKDGEYTGNAADAFYGIIQVKAVISGGRLTDVQFLQYPNDRRESIAINTAAIPELKSEAIRIQGSNVDIVSGATDSAIAFRESLQSALNQAK